MSGTASPAIIAADLDGSGMVKEVGGYSYFVQPVILTIRRTDGSSAVYHEREYFSYEQGSWRLLTTSTPTTQ
jgi:hypothetical protein